MTDGKAADGSRATGRHANNWDNRYDHDRFFYGEEPNYFVASQLASLPPGRLLGPATVRTTGLLRRPAAAHSRALARCRARHTRLPTVIPCKV